MEGIKPLIAIGHSDEEPWNTIRRAQELTWVSDFKKHYDVIYVKSRKGNSFVKKIDKLHENLRFKKVTGRFVGISDRMFLRNNLRNIPESEFDFQGDFVAHSYSTYATMNRRTYSLFKWFIQCTDYTHLFTTTSSSYLNLSGFNRMLRKNGLKSMLLAGSPFNDSEESSFVSGSGRLLSRDLVNRFLETKSDFPTWRIDDIAVSEHSKQLKANVEFWKRIDIYTYEDLTSFKAEAHLSRDVFHFRIKTQTRPNLDSEIMRSLHNFLS